MYYCPLCGKEMREVSRLGPKIIMACDSQELGWSITVRGVSHSVQRIEEWDYVEKED